MLTALAACASGAPSSGPAQSARSDRPSSAVTPNPSALPPAALTPQAPSVAVDDARALGSPQARLAIVEFGDYQCPYCRDFHLGTWLEIKRAYIDTGTVRYFYKDFPLPMLHPEAMGASVAAHCAGVQGQYWPMQARLYEQQARLGKALYAALARTLALDVERFDACVTGPAAPRAVGLDLAEGRGVGVRATPTFLLGRIENNRVIVERVAAGAPSFEAFANEIDALLKR